jgi:hypothetical protein
MSSPFTLALLATANADPALTFTLGSPEAPNAIFVGPDAGKANAQLALAIATNTSTTLTPGAPVAIGTAPTVQTSLIYLDLGPLQLDDAAFAAIGTGGGWAMLADAPNRRIAFALTTAGQPLAPGGSLAVPITGLVVAKPPTDGSSVQLTVSYYNIPNITLGFGNEWPMPVALLPPPGTTDQDLHLDLAMSFEPTRVVGSKDPWPPCDNTLALRFSPGPRATPVIAGPDSVFEVHFVYAEAPGFGALTTVKDATDPSRPFAPLRGQNADQWDDPLLLGSIPYVRLKPPAGQPIVVGSGVDAVVEFQIQHIVTRLQPGPTLMLVTYAGLPGYRAGSFHWVLTKIPHADIPTFTVTPASAQLSSSGSIDVQVDWVATDAAHLQLTSTSGLDEDVTPKTFFRTSIGETTTFTLKATGSYGADNLAQKSQGCTAAPFIDFKVVETAGGLDLRWSVLGARFLRLDWDDTSVDRTDPVGHQSVKRIPGRPPPFAFTLHALDANQHEIGSSTVYRWVPIASFSGRSVWPSEEYTVAQNTLAVSPDGAHVYFLQYVRVEDPPRNTSFVELIKLDAQTLALVGAIRLPIDPGFFAPSDIVGCMTTDGSRYYASFRREFNTGPHTFFVVGLDTFTLAGSFVVDALIDRPVHAIAAGPKHIFLLTDVTFDYKGPNQPTVQHPNLLALDTAAYALVWSDFVPDTGLLSFFACTPHRLHYLGEDPAAPQTTAVFSIDLDTLERTSTSLGTAFKLAAPVVTTDEIRAYLIDYPIDLPRQLWAFDAATWTGKTDLSAFVNAKARFVHLAATADGGQTFVVDFVEATNWWSTQLRVVDFDASARSYAQSGTLDCKLSAPNDIVLAANDRMLFVTDTYGRSPPFPLGYILAFAANYAW